MTKKTSKQKDTKKQTTKKPINYIKIFILLALTIGGGFSGIFFDKFDLKEKFINFRHAVYNYFTSEPIKHYTTKDNENIIARFFSQSDEGKNNSNNQMSLTTSSSIHQLELYQQLLIIAMVF